MEMKSRLKVILAEKDMSQQELLKKMKAMGKTISNGSMSDIVNGIIPKLETASYISKAIELPIELIWPLE